MVAPGSIRLPFTTERTAFSLSRAGSGSPDASRSKVESHVG
jgi:hypothetical protein